jgi:hypothetical protein
MRVIECLGLLNKSVDVGFYLGRLPVLDYWRVPVAACLHNTSPEAVSGEGLPSADCVLGYVGSIPWKQTEEQFREAIAESVKAAKREGWFNRPVLCAIDFHDDHYYGEYTYGVVGCYSREGTNQCFRIASLDVCEAGRRFTLAVIAVFKGTTATSVVKRLVKEARKYVKIKCLLMDRWFHSIPVYRALGQLKLCYIVCAKQTGKLLRAVEGRTFLEYTLKNSKDEYTVKLTVYRPDDKDLWVYATNLKCRPETVAYTYKRRWGIETGYKSKNKYSANTTSRRYKVRLFLILLAVVLFNLWVLTNLVADSATIRRLKPRIDYSTRVTIFKFKQSFIRHLADNG